MKRNILKFIFAIAFILPAAGRMLAQNTCATAINQCTSSQWNITSPTTPQGMPCTCCTPNPCTNPQGVNSGCLLSGGPNPTWLIITVQTSGMLGWNVGANSSGFPQAGFYDWAMFPYNASTCANISAQTQTPVACNWNGSNMGGTGMGTVPAGGNTVNYQPSISVTAGQQFIICITNFSFVNGTVVFQNSGSAQLGCCTAPTVNATASPTTICTGQSVTLTAIGASSYTWTPGGTTGSSITVSPTVTTLYTATGTSTSGCTGTGTANVVVNPIPTITAVSNPTAICFGSTATLTAGGGSTYTWMPGGMTGNNISVSPASTTIYTVTGASAAGCSSTKTVQLIVNPSPVITAANTGPYCAGTTISLSTQASSSYTWTGPAGYMSNLQNPTIAASQTTNAGVYTVTVSSAAGCKSTATTNVVMYPNPTPNIMSNSPVCAGQTLNFLGTGGTTYTWTGPASFMSNLQNPSVPSTFVANSGTYMLTVTDANGCVATTTANAVVNPLPVPSVNNPTACVGQPISLSANGGSSYAWTGPSGFTSGSQNPTIPNATTANTGQYTVVVSTPSSCSATAVSNVVVYTNPTPLIQTNSPVCVNAVLSLTGNGGAYYYWTGPNGFTSSAQSPTVLASTPAYSGTYSLTVSDANGCTGGTSATATVNPLPNVSIISSTNKGCSPLCVTFTAVSSSSVSYSWTLGNGVNDISSVTQTCYNTTAVYPVAVTVTDGAGCSSGATYTVQVFNHPTADFNYSPILPVEGDEVQFTDATYGATIASWNWYFMATAQNTSVLQNPVFSYANQGEYAVALVVKSTAGCVDTVVKSITVGEDFGLYVPNAFTPNGDGNNDIFYAKGFGVKKFEMDIFDRWGEKVFHAEDMNAGWDGTNQLKGTRTIADGVYTWRIKVTNVFGKSKEMTGHVTLIK